MMQEKLINAITELDSDILDRYFIMKQGLEVKKKQKNNHWIKWASLAACWCLIISVAFVFPMMQEDTGDIVLPEKGEITGVVKPDDLFYLNSGAATLIINYGPFIFIPILFVSLIPFGISFIKKQNTLYSLLFTSGVLLTAVNLLNILGVFVYSKIDGINIIGNLPIILITSNLGSLISLGILIPFVLKKMTWWKMLLIYLLTLSLSITIAFAVHNMILPLMIGDTFTVQ